MTINLPMPDKSTLIGAGVITYLAVGIIKYYAMAILIKKWNKLQPDRMISEFGKIVLFVLCLIFYCAFMVMLPVVRVFLKCILVDYNNKKTHGLSDLFLKNWTMLAQFQLDYMKGQKPR